MAKLTLRVQDFLYIMHDPPTFGDVLAVTRDMVDAGITQDVIDRIYMILDEIAKGA